MPTTAQDPQQQDMTSPESSARPAAETDPVRLAARVAELEAAVGAFLAAYDEPKAGWADVERTVPELRAALAPSPAGAARTGEDEEPTFTLAEMRAVLADAAWDGGNVNRPTRDVQRIAAEVRGRVYRHRAPTPPADGGTR